jgi:hypothetical protein
MMANSAARTPDVGLVVNLDEAGRAQIVTAACLLLYRRHLTSEMGEWRRCAADWSLPELMLRASELGVRYVRGNQPYTLPVSVTPIKPRP